jgi:hypothetical protein
MADAHMRASTETSVIVPEVWSKNYYDVLLAELPFESLISKDYEGEISALGDTVNISSIPEFAEAGELPTEESANDAEAVTITGQQLVINKQLVKDFIVTDKAKLQSLPFVEKLKSLAIYSIQKKIQSLIISLTIPSAAAPDHTLLAVTAGTYALADILASKELLDTAKVPMSDRHKILGAGPLNDIFNITGFTSSDFVASGSPLVTGELPSQLAGFMPHFTTVVGSTVYDFHKSYFTMASQKGIEVKEFDLGVIGKRGYRVNCTTLLGMKQLDNKRVVTTTV